MGNRGGFNPFRDANGEFTTPDGSGKLGRSRARSGSSGGGATQAGRVAAKPAERASPRISRSQLEDLFYQSGTTGQDDSTVRGFPRRRG